MRLSWRSLKAWLLTLSYATSCGLRYLLLQPPALLFVRFLLPTARLFRFAQDRHNGNVLIDDAGHICHIDYGFILGISPGGNLGFENAAFKLSPEMIELLGGMNSEPFLRFVELTVRGFLVARRLVGPLVSIVSSMADSSLPCFSHKDDNLARMYDRFYPNERESEAARRMRDLVYDAANKWTTKAYDGIQKLQNNIYSDTWR